MSMGGAERGPRARVGRRRGFSLLEFVVVLVILSLGAAAAVPAFRALAEDDEMTLATRRVQALFRMARDSALTAGVPFTVVIDSATGGFWLDSPAREPLPPAVSDPFAFLRTIGGAGTGPGMFDARPIDAGAPTPLDLPAGVRLDVSRARARFTFLANGSALADSMVLRAGGRARLVKLNPWTGDVVVR